MPHRFNATVPSRDIRDRTDQILKELMERSRDYYVRDGITTEKQRRGASPGFALVTISHALNHVYDTLFPILYPSLIAEFELSYSLVGLLALSYRMSSGMLQIVMGFLGRFARMKIILGIGMIWQCIANSFVSISQTFGHVLISRASAGVGSSPQHPVASSYIAKTFSRKQLGRALGTNVAAGQFGNFITPLLASLVVVSIGWRATVLVFTIPGMVTGLGFLLMHEPKHSEAKPSVSSLRFLTDGLREVFRNKAILGVMILQAIMAFRIGARDFLPAYLVNDLGVTTIQTGILFTTFTASAIPAPYVWGFMSDRIGRRAVVLSVMSAAAVFWYLLPYARVTLHLLLILALIGFVGQGVGAVVQAFVADSTTDKNRDLVYGIYFTFTFGLGSMSPLVLGYIADSFGFQACFEWLAMISFAAVLASAGLLRETA